MPHPDDSFAGEWSTTFGPMRIDVHGRKASGRYGDGGEFEGSIEGDTLRFAYSEPGERGKGSFRQLRHGKFVGEYLAQGADRARRWEGARGWDGVWDTTFGRMRLIHEADRIHGFYDGVGAASIDGTLDGARFTFRYAEPKAAGDAWFVLDEAGRRFAGEWRADGSGDWAEWTGTRLDPEPRVTWLFVVEAHWQRSLAENEYAFGNMLREVFARLPDVRVRQRFFHDAESLEHWCRELLYLPEPAVLVIASHGVPEGLSVHGEVINTTRVLETIRYAETLRLLHFSACLVGKDGEKALAKQPFPVSGYTTSVDWGASAMIEFTFLDMILNRGLAPAAAAALLPDLVTYAGDRAPEGSPYPAAGFRFFDAHRPG